MGEKNIEKNYGIVADSIVSEVTAVGENAYANKTELQDIESLLNDVVGELERIIQENRDQIPEHCSKALNNVKASIHDAPGDVKESIFSLKKIAEEIGNAGVAFSNVENTVKSIKNIMQAVGLV